MNDYFTWTTLGTYAGAVLATTLFTQLLKDIPAIKVIPTRLFSYLVATIILVGATIFSVGFSWGALALALVNAVVVSLAANGSYDAGALLMPPQQQQ